MAKNNKNASAKKNKSAKSDLNAKGEKKFTARVSQFFKDLNSETKKIVWTSGSDTMKNTLVVLLVVLVVGIGVWIADALLIKGRTHIVENATAQAETAVIMLSSYLGSIGYI